MEDRYSFADSFTGLAYAFHTSLYLRRHGHRTRLVPVPITLTKGIPAIMYTVIATPTARPNRKERGCNLKEDRMKCLCLPQRPDAPWHRADCPVHSEAPHVAQARQIATMYNAVAAQEYRPDLEENQ